MHLTEVDNRVVDVRSRALSDRRVAEDGIHGKTDTVDTGAHVHVDTEVELAARQTGDIQRTIVVRLAREEVHELADLCVVERLGVDDRAFLADVQRDLEARIRRRIAGQHRVHEADQQILLRCLQGAGRDTVIDCRVERAFGRTAAGLEFATQDSDTEDIAVELRAVHKGVVVVGTGDVEVRVHRGRVRHRWIDRIRVHHRKRDVAARGAIAQCRGVLAHGIEHGEARAAALRGGPR